MVFAFFVVCIGRYREHFPGNRFITIDMAKRNHLIVSSSVRAAWAKRLLIAGIVLIAGVALWRFVVGEMGVVKYYRMSTHARELRNDIDRMRKDNVRLSKEVAALKHDSAYLERLARDKIGLARPGEVVYYYGESHR